MGTPSARAALRRRLHYAQRWSSPVGDKRRSRLLKVGCNDGLGPGFMVDGFDVVPVGPNDEGSIVSPAVLRA